MKSRLIVVVSLLMLSCSQMYAATSGTATVTYTVSSIDAITVSGNPGSFIINSATAGSAPTSATNAATTYAVTTNNTARKIYGALSSTMPTGTTLTVNLAAPTGGTSAGVVSLTTTSQALVTGVTKIVQASLAITYTFSATVSAVQVATASNTLTYTIGP